MDTLIQDVPEVKQTPVQANGLEMKRFDRIHLSDVRFHEFQGIP
jgi:hypothetical protein